MQSTRPFRCCTTRNNMPKMILNKKFAVVSLKCTTEVTSTCCVRMIVITKQNGNPRRTVNLHNRRTVILHTYYMPSSFDIVSTVLIKTRKTALDTWNGYHSLVLYETLRETRTFITKWDRYPYYRAPMEFHVSSNA